MCIGSLPLSVFAHLIWLWKIYAHVSFSACGPVWLYFCRLSFLFLVRCPKQNWLSWLAPANIHLASVSGGPSRSTTTGCQHTLWPGAAQTTCQIQPSRHPGLYRDHKGRSLSPHKCREAHDQGVAAVPAAWQAQESVCMENWTWLPFQGTNSLQAQQRCCLLGET